ncbi:MAG: hemolysin III family protein [Planctomycetia bacterium]|nr:hemolysin III family protein [Planctomycetia bacterium]
MNTINPFFASWDEEVANAITHGIGIVLSLFASVFLIHHAYCHAPAPIRLQTMVGYSVFGLSLLFLYCMSTFYHAATRYRWKLRFQTLDHLAIYILIAGSYTAFCLAAFHSTSGIIILSMVWFLAILGIVLQSLFKARFRPFALVFYLAMGWMIVGDYPGLIRQVDPVTIKLILYGGLAYTFGFIFYSLQRFKWMHTVWHFFVLFGSFFHILAAYAAIS